MNFLSRTQVERIRQQYPPGMEVTKLLRKTPWKNPLLCRMNMALYAIEAMGTRYGVVKTAVASRNWTGWCKNPYINYMEGSMK